jgi:RNA polymerase sigma factor (sigma-70 family)
LRAPVLTVGLLTFGKRPQPHLSYADSPLLTGFIPKGESELCPIAPNMQSVAANPIFGRAVSVIPNESMHADCERTRVLYERHRCSIFAHCLRQLRDRLDAEDAMQATFLNAFRSVRSGFVPELELSWLFAIANHVIANRRRADARRRRVEAPTDLSRLHDAVASPTVESDDLAHLDEALAAIPEQQRRALMLREWHGLAYREICAQLELSQGAVEQLIFRARRSLAEELTRRSGTSTTIG